MFVLPDGVGVIVIVTGIVRVIVTLDVIGVEELVNKGETVGDGPIDPVPVPPVLSEIVGV